MFDQLKLQTKENHINLEKVFISRIRDLQTAEDYGKFLADLYNYFLPLETKINFYITEDLLPDMQSRRKAHKLLDDMHKINYSFSSRINMTGPLIDSMSSAAGVLYVLEGSTHGGPHIAKMIQGKLRLSDDCVTYFSGYGEETANRWSHLKSSFEKNAHLLSVPEMISSANSTFTNLEQWLQLNSKKNDN